MRSKSLFVLICAAVALVLAAGFYFWLHRDRHPAGPDPVYGDRPILRLNPAQHSGTIWRAGITEDGRLMATVGSDNVVKIWRLDDPDKPRVVNTLRVPISNEAAIDPSLAMLRAVAISPRGRWIAAAGKTGADGTYRLLVLDTATGEIVRELLNTPGIIADVAFSRDGQSLAAGLYACDGKPPGPCADGHNGLWVWNTANWDAAPYRDKAYQGLINGIAFNSAGDLFTTSYDRKLRRYGAAQLRMPGFAPTPVPARPFGKGYDRDVRPYDLAVSPDGRTVLVGYDQDDKAPASLTQYKASDLTPLRDFDLSSLPGDHGRTVEPNVVNGVSFSGDGEFVYAALAEESSGTGGVRRWSVANRNAGFEDFRLCTSQTIIQVLPYQRRGAIFASSDPCVSRIDDKGKRVDEKRLIYPIYDGNLGPTDPGLFQVSENGDRFYLAHEKDGDGIAFDLRERRLTENPPAKHLSRRGVSDGYQQTGGGTTMSGWCCSSQKAPTINGVPIDLDGGVSWSTDVAHNGDFAVLGTSKFLARYNRDGSRAWPYSSPDIPRRVNITPNGRTVVALYRDGVIRWHDASKKKVLLNLFIAADGKNWVMWTPAGYYDSSPGGDAILGWHLNNGRNEAPSWLPVGRYASAFRRPDMINHVIAYIRDGKTTPGFEAANSTKLADDTIRGNAPPIVQITDASLDSRGMLVTYRVSSPSGDPVTSVRIDVNGRPEAADQLNVRPGQSIQRSIPVDWGTDEYVGIRAVNQHGVGEVATVRIPDVYRNTLRRGVDLPSAQKPVLHALVVGLNYDYEGRGERFKLCCAEHDAEEFKSFLETQNRQGGRSLYSDVKVVPLTRENATLAALKSNLERLSRLEGNNVALIFLAGHGVPDSLGHYYFIPWGVDPTSPRLRDVALSGARITQALRDAKVPVMLFMDTCNSRGALERSFLNDVYNLQRNVLVFSSSQDGHPSIEKESWMHGAFTKALLEAVEGDAPDDDADDLVNYDELGPYLRQAVKALTGNAQVPEYFGWGPEGANPDFNLFSVNGRRRSASSPGAAGVAQGASVRRGSVTGGNCSDQAGCQLGWGTFARPPDLWVDSATRIQFSVAPDQPRMKEELDGAIAAKMKSIMLAARMKVKLLPDPNFKIVPLSPPDGEQPIGPDQRASWIWDVTPIATDNKPHSLTAIVEPLDADGQQIETYTKNVTVTVRIGTWRGFINAMQNAGSAGDVVSAASQSWQTAIVSITALVTALGGLFVAIRALRSKTGRQRASPAEGPPRKRRRR